MSTHAITEFDEIKRHSNWGIFTGILTALLGVFLIAFPLFTATITTLLFGGILIFVGIAQFFFALHSGSVGRFLLKILLSALYVITGVVIAFFPIAGVAALTLVLGTLLLAAAALETLTAFQLRPVKGWGWFLFDAGASLLMGILILAGWPVSSIWAIGTLVGIAVLMNGLSRVALAAKMRRVISRIEPDIQRAA